MAYSNRIFQRNALYSTLNQMNAGVLLGNFPSSFLSFKLTSKSFLLINSANSKRSFTNGNDPSPMKLPPLMKFPEIVWPSFYKSIRNFILSTFIIKPYFDKEFSIREFVRGSKQAVEVVSTKLGEGDLKSLDGLVTTDVIPHLQKAVSAMSLSQRDELSVKSEDIYFSFPYEIGVMFSDNGGKDGNKRFVEITVVFHALRGLALMKSRGEEPPINAGMVPEYRNRLSICNYRFIKEFTKGVQSDWTVNLLNHFKPVDYVEE